MSDAYLYLSEIRIDGDTQARVNMDKEDVKYFADIMREHGEQHCPFPAVRVVYDGENRWLYDGFHRYEAAVKANYQKIRAIIEPGTLEDAKWKCLGVNIKRAIPRTFADKRNVVLRALAHPRGQGDSSGLIALHCGVAQSYVNDIKKELREASAKLQEDATCSNGKLPIADNPILSSPEKEQGKKIRTKNGKKMDASNIGKGRKQKRDVAALVAEEEIVANVDSETAVITTPIDNTSALASVPTLADLIPAGMMLVPIEACYHAPTCHCHANCFTPVDEIDLEQF